MSLTEEQRAAVSCDDNLLLTACPGSGKTRVIIEKLMREIDMLRGSGKAVACITYTNTAVQEIEERANLLLLPDDEVHLTVATIHGFCLQSILRPFAWLSEGFTGHMAVLTPDHPQFQEIVNQAAARVNLFRLDNRDYEAFSGLSLDINGEIIGAALRNDAVRRSGRYFWQICSERGFIDFANILYKSYCILRNHPFVARSLGSRYAAFYIDEFQDTTEIQIEILKLIYAQGRSRFFAVGDPAQSIYGFAGARPELIAPFAEHIGARTDLTLTGNFRSNPQVVAQANRLLPREPAMLSVGKYKDCTQQPVVVTGLSTFNAITEQFLPKLEELGIPLGDAAILAREWWPLFDLSRRLREFGTPIVGPGARPYRRSRLFASLAEQLCAFAVSPRTHSIKQVEVALFHAVQDVTAERRLEVFQYAGRIALTRLMREARRLAAAGLGGSRWLDEMSRATGDILSNLEFITPADARRFFASVQEMKSDMQRQGVSVDDLSIEDLGMFANPQTALRLGTIYYAKGREYKAVALINLQEGQLPHRWADDIEAEKRVMYVGITRAERLIMYVVAPGGAPSRFLGEGLLAVLN